MSPPAVRLMAVRHAPTDAEGICVGRFEVPVLVEHQESAARILDQLSIRPDAVHSSPNPRCHDPAALVARHLGVTHHVAAELHEIHLGRWEGRRWAAIEREEPEPFAAYMANWERATPHGGESPADVADRVARWRRDLHPGLHLLVAHAGVVRALRVFMGASWAEAMRRSVRHLELISEL